MGYTRIQVRNDPSHLWALANPVLAVGEFGVETDTLGVKFGDGTTAWNDLLYVCSPGGASPESVDWGSIIGNIASNAALLQALNGKQNTSEKGKAEGYAPLDENKKIPDAHIPTTLEKTSNRGAIGGYAPLDGDGVVPGAHLPEDLEYTSQRGVPDGYAGLGSDGKLFTANIPMSVERTANKALPGGYAPLGADGKVPTEHLPPVSPSGGGGDMPRGAIIMWSGALADIPEGWALCDGTKGTPNLLDKFIACVPDGKTNPGEQGGTHAQRLTVNQLPAHKHAASGGEHTHEMNHIHDLASSNSEAAKSGSHYHTFKTGGGASAGVIVATGSILAMQYQQGSSIYNTPASQSTLERRVWTEDDPGHSHSLKGSTKGPSQETTGGLGGSSLNITISETGNNATFDNRPAYYTLALIMKL